MSKKYSSLRNRVFFFFILLLIAVQAVSFLTTQISNKRLESQQLVSQLQQAETLLKNEFENRSYYLTAFAETAAKDYGLKQVLVEDTRSLLVALNNHRKRVDADIAIAFNADGVTVGELFIKDSNKDIKRVATGELMNKKFHYQQWLTNESTTSFYQTKNDTYQLVIAPITNGDIIIGHVGFGYALNNKLSTVLANITGFNVGFGFIEGTNWQWLAANTEQPFLEENIGQPGFSPLISQLNEDYIFANYQLGSIGDKQLSATTYQLTSNLIAAIKQDSFQLLMMIAITLIISLLGAYIIASGVTKPLRRMVKLTEDIARGNYQSDVYVGHTHELNQLALQFGKMQEAIRSREQEITSQAFLDTLTTLPNRNQFYKDMHGLDQSFILCQINIRRLSEINDTLGHEVGDDVILEVAKRLKMLNKPIYHTSGNGFLIRCDNETLKDVKPCIQTINSFIEPSFSYQNIALHLQVNIGVTYSDGWAHANQLLKEVDSAMQIAKKQNLLYQLYDRQIDLNTLDRLQLVNRLKQAIENDEFTLFFQPKLNLTNQTVDEVEALVRWVHPVNGLITPDAFIHIAEQTGQMKALSHWVINKAIEQHFAWQAKGVDLKIAVNISPDNLLDNEFCLQLIAKLCGKRTLHKHLSFEITEDAFVDHSSKAVENINLLRKHGINLSIDDYGTGYSSLAQLKHLPVQELKIDKCFIEKLTHQVEDQLIVSSTITLSHQLGLSVVAEGVEDQITLDWLTQNGCEKAQGYFISRPLPAEDFFHWLMQSTYNKVLLENHEQSITTIEKNTITPLLAATRD